MGIFTRRYKEPAPEITTPDQALVDEFRKAFKQMKDVSDLLKERGIRINLIDNGKIVYPESLKIRPISRVTTETFT